MADWNDTPTGKTKLNQKALSYNTQLMFSTAIAGDGGFTADETTSNTAWAPQDTTGGEGFDDDTGYIGQDVSKHAGTHDSGCRK